MQNKGRLNRRPVIAGAKRKVSRDDLRKLIPKFGLASLPARTL
jgi:hypothetical protein